MSTSLHLRCHIVDEFNQGIYNYIIATDEIPEWQPTVRLGNKINACSNEKMQCKKFLSMEVQHNKATITKSVPKNYNSVMALPAKHNKSGCNISYWSC